MAFKQGEDALDHVIEFKSEQTEEDREREEMAEEGQILLDLVEAQERAHGLQDRVPLLFLCEERERQQERREAQRQELGLASFKKQRKFWALLEEMQIAEDQAPLPIARKIRERIHTKLALADIEPGDFGYGR